MCVEYTFFVGSFVGGLVAMQYSEKGPLSTRILGEMCWAGGFIPLVSTLFNLLGSSDSILTLKQPKNGLSVLIFTLGVILLWPEPSDGWLAQVAGPLLEGALIYWIHRFLFIAADDSEYIKKLERENAKLR